MTAKTNEPPQTAITRRGFITAAAAATAAGTLATSCQPAPAQIAPPRAPSPAAPASAHAASAACRGRGIVSGSGSSSGSGSGSSSGDCWRHHSRDRRRGRKSGWGRLHAIRARADHQVDRESAGRYSGSPGPSHRSRRGSGLHVRSRPARAEHFHQAAQGPSQPSGSGSAARGRGRYRLCERHPARRLDSPAQDHQAFASPSSISTGSLASAPSSNAWSL